MTSPARARKAPDPTMPDPYRWMTLIVASVVTLMVVLDVSIVSIALPQAQSDLGMSDASRQWMITSYALTFGGLLLLGGRIADWPAPTWPCPASVRTTPVSPAPP